MAMVQRGFLLEIIIPAVILPATLTVIRADIPVVIPATGPRPNGFLRRRRRTPLARTPAPPLAPPLIPHCPDAPIAAPCSSPLQGACSFALGQPSSRTY